MRWLLRLLIVWAIGGPLFYFLVLPLLLDALTEKVRKEAHVQCIENMRSRNMFGSPGSPLQPEQAEKYCNCVSDGLIFSRNDVFDTVRHRPTAALNALAESLSTQCNDTLQKEIESGTPPDNRPEDPGLIHL